MAEAATAPAAKEVEVNGVRLPYVEQGSGKPVVLVHGAVADLRVWEPVREALAQNHRVIAYTQRYFGAAPWPDEGKAFSVATHADDLAKFVTYLNAGPVHLVGWSYGGTVAAVAAVNNPRLVASLVLYEPALGTVLVPESPEAKQAAAERAPMFGPAVAASNAGDHVQATLRLIEGVFQLPPGEAARQPEQWQAMWRDNARTVPLLFAAPPPAATCDMLQGFTKPTLVLIGEETKSFFPVIAERVRACIPGAERVILSGVNHDAPVRDPAGFSAVVSQFVSKH
jgi:pimeloyl-ACP methyl ester carboxylesterase